MRAIIEISGTVAEVRRVMMSYGLLEALPYVPLPAAQDHERCRRYYESGTWSAAAIGFSGTADRRILDNVRFDGRKFVEPTVDITYTGTIAGVGGSISAEAVDEDGFRVRVSDGDGSSGAEGIEVVGAEWTADTGK